jgi:hypothetical protein
LLLQSWSWWWKFLYFHLVCIDRDLRFLYFDDQCCGLKNKDLDYYAILLIIVKCLLHLQNFRNYVLFCVF